MSDSQYHSFREKLPVMGLLLVLHPILRRAWDALWPIASSDGSKRPTPDMADARLNQRTCFDFTFALIYLVVLHGFSAAKVLLILYINYSIAKMVPGRAMPAATWMFNIGLLFANELCQGYKFRNMAMFLTGPPQDLVSDPALVSLGTWMDNHGGLIARWEILFNITILRLISFNLDYYWSLDKRNVVSLEVCLWHPTVDETGPLTPLRRSK